jgi:methionine synthase I (cobalamin-dependent)
MRQAAPGAYLIAKPNAGLPHMIKRKVVFDASPERMADLARRFVNELGVAVVGGCCGSEPKHIAAIAAAVK